MMLSVFFPTSYSLPYRYGRLGRTLEICNVVHDNVGLMFRHGVEMAFCEYIEEHLLLVVWLVDWFF